MKDVNKISKLIDWKSLLIENYKSLDMTEKELAIVLIIDSYKNSSHPLVTPDLIALKHNSSVDEIDSIMSTLMTKKIISIEDGTRGLETSLKPLIDKLTIKFIDDSSKNDEDDEVFTLLEDKFGRPLSQFEISTIRNWIENGETMPIIKEAINLAVFAHRKNINYIDQVLLEWRRKSDVASQGVSTATNDKWRKNIDQTIELAKLNWLED